MLFIKQFLLLAITALCVFVIVTDSFAQRYRPGFIVQIEGDTIKGLIKYRESNQIFKSCAFKKESNLKAQEYLPGEIIAYGFINDALYESKDIENAKGVPLKAFVEVLVHGELSLYQ